MRVLFLLLIASFALGDTDDDQSSSSDALVSAPVVPAFPVGLTGSAKSAPYLDAVKGTYEFTGVASDGIANTYPLVASNAGPLHLVLTDDMPTKPTPNPIFSPPTLDVLCTPRECASELDAFAPETMPLPPDSSIQVNPWSPPSCDPVTNAATARCGPQLRACLAASAFSGCDASVNARTGLSLGKTVVDAVTDDRNVISATQPERIALRNTFLDALQSSFVGAGQLVSLAVRIIADNENYPVSDFDPKKEVERVLVSVVDCWKKEVTMTPQIRACECYLKHGKCWRAAGCLDSIPKEEKDHCFRYMACQRAQCEGSGAAGAAVAAAALLAAAAAVLAVAIM
jgi:hypothetical protein